MTIHFTCVGDICGDCRVKHRTPGAADRCCRQHHRDVMRGHPGGRVYSDRAVRAVEEDGVLRRLTDDEWVLADQ